MIIRLTIFISNISGYFAATAVLLMMLHVTLDVLAIHFFGTPIFGTAEIVASYYMIGVVFMPLAMVEINGTTIVVDMFHNMMPALGKRLAWIVGDACSLAFMGLLTWLSWLMATNAYEKREMVVGVFDIIIWPSRFFLPIGLGLACFVLAVRLVISVAGGDRELIKKDHDDLPVV